MTHQIIKKSNGLYAVWSTVIDDFIFDDAAKDDIIEYYVELYREGVIQLFGDIDAGKPVYYNTDFNTYEEACEYRDEVHEDE